MLIEDLPAPPLRKLLDDYLPTLMRDRSEFTVKQIPKDQIVTPVHKAAEKRNTLVHKSPTAIKSQHELQEWMRGDSLQTALMAISDLLWLLDYYRGYHWALEHVQDDTRIAWAQQSIRPIK